VPGKHSRHADRWILPPLQVTFPAKTIDQSARRDLPDLERFCDDALSRTSRVARGGCDQVPLGPREAALLRGAGAAGVVHDSRATFQQGADAADVGQSVRQIASADPRIMVLCTSRICEDC
jgi:hypothetical protein